MASFTLSAKLAGMCIILRMAGKTICGRVFEVSVFMAAFTSDGCMFAIQLERELRMIDRPVPSIGCVAGGAVSAELTGMFVVFCMA